MESSILMLYYFRWKNRSIRKNIIKKKITEKKITEEKIIESSEIKNAKIINDLLDKYEEKIFYYDEVYKLPDSDEETVVVNPIENNIKIM